MCHLFHGQEFTFTQPDGTHFKVLGWGDQNKARFKTPDGQPVTFNTQTGFYEFAEPPAVAEGVGAGDLGETPIGAEVMTSRTGPEMKDKSRWQIRREAQRAPLAEGAEAPPSRTTVGTFIGLCLPVRFKDIGTTITPTMISDFCNKPGYSEYGNNGSVRDYFLANSGGRCDYTTIVAPLYTARHPRKYYTDPKIAQPIRAQELVEETLAYHMKRGFDFSRLTTDTDNYVYAINLFYAGEVVNNWSEGLWPHQYHLAKFMQIGTGKLAYDYQITALGRKLALGTYCHENGHMLCNFPDLYDYGGESFGAGLFCLMAGGNHADQNNPVQVGAYLKFRAGWAGSVTEIADGLDTPVEAGGNNFYILRKDDREYFILENRDQSGRDAALPDGGLAVWHVDEMGDNSSEQGTPDAHYECALMQADGRTDLETRANQGDADDLFSDGAKFAGAWWDRTPTGLQIEFIGPPGPRMRIRAKALLHAGV